MAKRTASAKWDGTLKAGSGRLALGSGAFAGPYTFKSRFEDGEGTNPEELIAAAQAGCFSMQLSLVLGNHGHDPDSIETEADVRLEPKDGGFAITRIDLRTTGRVPGIDQDHFAKHAAEAKDGCLVSQALGGVGEITSTPGSSPEPMKSDAFRSAAEAKDFASAEDLFAAEVVFRSPVVYKPYEGREAVRVLLAAVVQVFEDFRYLKQVETGDMAMLMFEASVGDRALQGVDILRFGEDGRIVEMIVMVRPMSGVLALAERMKQLLEAAELAAAGDL